MKDGDVLDYIQWNKGENSIDDMYRKTIIWETRYVICVEGSPLGSFRPVHIAWGQKNTLNKIVGPGV